VRLISKSRIWNNCFNSAVKCRTVPPNRLSDGKSTATFNTCPSVRDFVATGEGLKRKGRGGRPRGMIMAALFSGPPYGSAVNGGDLRGFTMVIFP
jgi:hypothetical protein